MSQAAGPGAQPPGPSPQGPRHPVQPAIPTAMAQPTSGGGAMIAAWVIAIVLALLLGLILLGGFALVVLEGRLNPTLWLVYAGIAAISLVVIMGVIALADRWDPQPLPLLMIAVLWGAAVAASIAWIANSVMLELLYAVTGDEATALFTTGTFVAPVVEETAKGLGLVLLLLLARRVFNGPLDGLVYGALIGGGFAFVENIGYYLDVPEAGGTITDSVVVVVVRGVIGIFGHAIYTSLTGVIMGWVIRRWGLWPGVLSFLVATWPGIALHACWNGGTTILQNGLGLPGLVVMLILEFVFSGLWLALIGFLVMDESRLTRRRLGDYARMGWLTEGEADMLGTWRGRREGRRWARSIGAAPAMRRFIRDAAHLASTRQQILTDGPRPRALADERRLLAQMQGSRQALLAAAGR